MLESFLKLRVIDGFGRRPSLGRSLLRTAAYLPSALLLALGFLWIGFDREKRGLHDWLADTWLGRGCMVPYFMKLERVPEGYRLLDEVGNFLEFPAPAGKLGVVLPMICPGLYGLNVVDVLACVVTDGTVMAWPTTSPLSSVRPLAAAMM